MLPCTLRQLNGFDLMYFSKTPMEWDEKIPLSRQDLQDLLDFLLPAAKRPLAEGPFILIIFLILSNCSLQ